ncbi:MAG: N-acetyl-gamma-glutamyl-phosphate reductase [Candidatus Omnitrophica bacterium]|nr:N-acetyl-gamma-glutamyl-phosphate reductase [Candidatus Omnitrophota bacterium]
MLNVGIIGATGYTGEELISILLRHPEVRITYLAAKIETPLPIAEIFPKFKKRINLICEPPDIKKAGALCDLIFLALPHTVSMNFAPYLLRVNKHIIDLSADYRLKNTKTYEIFYRVKHKDKNNLKKAVYGLAELYRNKIKKARFIANPGCYPTGVILALAPLIGLNSAATDTIIVDAKSGATGAGRRGSLPYFFSEVNEDARPYKINTHQHIPEINQELSALCGRSIKINFVPHLIPLNRGIMETIYIKQTQSEKRKPQNLIELYKRFYKNEPFVRIKEKDDLPSLKDVVYTNFCDIAIRVFPKQELIIVFSAIDNLIKGASGQAVQNMNIMYGFPETMGLI